MTIADCAAAAARVLTDAGVAEPDARADIGVLARHRLGWTGADWVARSRDQAADGFFDTLLALARRRSTGEPVAYITGVREFYGRPFGVSPAVLIPRPETELLITEALAHAQVTHRAQLRGCSGAEPARGPVGPVIADVGTGSGCLAVTLALEIPGARIVATDVSPDALEVARANARALGAGRVEFVAASLLPPGRFDLIVSNPPYVAERDRASLPPDVRDFEPASALFAGEDGLGVIRGLVPAAAPALLRGGRLVMEIGAGQADEVAQIVRDARLELEGVRPDLQGIPRVVIARQPG